MKLRDLSGTVRKVKLSMNYEVNPRGQLVLLVDGEPLGALDIAGWQIVDASKWEREELEKAGYHLPEEG